MAQQNSIKDMTKEEILLKLLHKEKGYYAVILELGRHIQESLESKAPIAEVHQLLRKKNILLGCIEDIEKALAPLKKYWKEKRDRSDPAAQQVSVQMQVLASFVKEILDIEERNEQLFQELLRDVKQK